MKYLYSVILMCLCSLSISAQKTFVYSDHEPYGNMRTRFIVEEFFKGVAKRTKGKVSILPKWNAEIARGYDALAALQQHKADLAVVVPEYVEKALPRHQLFKSFPVGPSGGAQVKFLREAYRDIPELTDELDAQNIHVVLIATGYPVAFYSKDLLDSLSGIKAKTWRSASFWQRNQIDEYGGKGITTPWGDGVIEALNQGRLDGLMVNVDSGVDLGINKMAPYALASKSLWLGHVYLVAMNKDEWDALSAEEKTAIEGAAEHAYAKLGKIMDRAYQTMFLKVLSTGGKTIRNLTKQEVGDWLQHTHYEQYQDLWARQKEAEGATKVVDTLEKLRLKMQIYLHDYL